MTIILRTQDCSVIVVYSAHSLSHSFRQLFHIHFLLTLLIHPLLQILSDEDLASPEKQPISDLPKLSLPHVLFHYLSRYTMPSLVFLWMNSAPTHGDLSLVLQISLPFTNFRTYSTSFSSLSYQLFFYGWNIPFVIQTCYCNIPLKSKALFLTLYSPPITTQFFYSPLQQKSILLLPHSHSLLNSLPSLHRSRSSMISTMLNIMTKFQLSFYFTKQLHLTQLITPPS